VSSCQGQGHARARERATQSVEVLAFERGLMVLGCGETSLRLCPPLIVSEQEATVALDILEEALTEAEKEHAGTLAATTALKRGNGCGMAKNRGCCSGT